MLAANDDPVTLLCVVAMLAVVLAGGWVIASLALRLAPRAAMQFALSNLLFMVGALLETRRGHASGYLAYQGADLIELVACTLLRSGVQRLEHFRFTGREHVAVPIVAGAVLFAIPPSDEGLAWIVAAYGLAMGWVSLRLYAEASRSLRSYMGRWSTLGIMWPSAAYGLIMLARSLWYATHPSGVGLHPDITVAVRANIALLWTVIVLLLVSNMALIGLVVGRLTSKTRDLARRDPLTGAFNRRVLEERLAAEHLRLQRGGPGFAVAMIDLDHFKSINDTLGHAGGDEALRHAAKIIGGLLRTVDTLARYGGEEFVVVFAMTDLAGAVAAAERMRARLVAERFQWAGHGVTVSASVGVAACSTASEPIESLMQRADRGTYLAKENGRNRVESVSLLAA